MECADRYVYVHHTQRVREAPAGGGGRLGQLYEGLVERAHSISETASAMGCAVGVARDLAVLSFDGRQDSTRQA